MRKPTNQLDLFAENTTPQKIDLGSDNSPVINAPKTNDTPIEEYEVLDYQLADLMIELNDFIAADEADNKLLNESLKRCTLDISKRTREGQIALDISLTQQAIILQSTVVGRAGEYMPLIIDEGYLYLNRYWQYQQQLAEKISLRINSKKSLSDAQKQWTQDRLEVYFPNNESISGQKEINWQKRAAELALENSFLIVSGGPGTGKTTTITRLLALLIEQYLHISDSVNKPEKDLGRKWGGGSSEGFNILLAAPTGKAAIRMLDSIREVSQSIQQELQLDEYILEQMPKQSSTIHKLLGYIPNSVEFRHNRNNPLNANVVLVDEASMIDIALMSKLIEAIPSHAKLILIGDKDQLASVETGSVFSDICEALENNENLDATRSLVTLRKNWRFTADSDIGQCAIAANRGEAKHLLNILKDENKTDAELIVPVNMRDAETIKPWQDYFEVLNNPNSSLPEIFAAFNQYRVLCALRRGLNGSQTMTDRIETALEKQGLITRRRDSNHQHSNWYHGRPIMVTQNSYSRGLFNGDTGITLIRDGEIKVFFPATENSSQYSLQADGLESAREEFNAFSPIRLPVHETTWAMTIHKSQGSEFNQVVLILPNEEIPLLTRQLIYTGITRAKAKVSIVANESVLIAGVKAEVLRATRIII